MKLAGVLAALLLTIGAAVALTGSGDSGGVDRPPVALGDVRLVSVDSCDDLLTWFRTTAESMDPGYLTGFAYGYGGDVRVMAGAPGAEASATSAAGAGTAARDSVATTTAEAKSSADFSGTNIQEKGVDEPDTVKTNGRLLITAGPDKLEIVDVTGDAPKLVSTMPIEQGGTELLLSGDRLLTLSNVWRPDPAAQQPQPSGDNVRVMVMPVLGKPITVVSSIDISDPAQPRLVERRELDGSYRTARVTGTTARLVLVSSPQVPAPGPGVSAPTEEIAKQKMKEWRTQAIASMTLQDWAPLANKDCSSVVRTAQPEGLSTTSVLTLDVNGSLDTLDIDSVVADTGTVYASPNRLVLATSRWSQFSNPAGQATTELHAFDITGEQTSYTGSGAVPGYLLNQFALSERNGYLRVATTQEPPWQEQVGAPAPESAITSDASVSQTAELPTVTQTRSAIDVLDERDGALVVVGRVDGLGVTERIQAVRYIGDLAYVVTFRQKDPLYVVDLSDPTAPRVAGQLKVSGYSAYLHPIDNDRLVGVGQDATDDGQVLGTQVATFDISDPAAPSRIDVTRIDRGTSPIEYDHRAFLWWAKTRTIVVPVQIFDPGVIEPMPAPAPDCAPDATCANEGGGATTEGKAVPITTVPSRPQAQPFNGAIVFAVSNDGRLSEVGRITHAGRGSNADGVFSFMVMRSVVIGNALYTLSDGGVLRSDLTTLADQGFAAFPAPNYDAKPMSVDG